MLNGKVPALDHEGKKGSKPNDVARANTLALIERMMLEETELAAVSYEGTRQLMFASGVLPRHVTLPNWLSNGALSTFTRPRGPAYITQGDDEKPYMSIALSTGYGVPNYVLHRYFTEMGDSYHKELNPDPVKLLENVLKDAYFTAARDGEDPDPAPPQKKPKKKDEKIAGQPQPQPQPQPLPLPPIGVPSGEEGRIPGVQPLPLPNGGNSEAVVSLLKKQARLSIKANATAWALYYYLANARPDELRAYIAELNKFPRDLPIDGRTAYDAFVRTFNLASKGGAADPERMKRFANDWLSYMQTVPKGSIDIDLESAVKTPKPAVEDPTIPMTPKDPGRGP